MVYTGGYRSHGVYGRLPHTVGKRGRLPHQLGEREATASVGREGGYLPTLVYPPWCTLSSHHCIYASRLSWFNPGFNPGLIPECEQLSFTLLIRMLKEGGLCPKERLPSHLRINLRSWQKQLKRDQQTRYRKHLCTRVTRIPQPLHNCHQTPLKAIACPFTVSLLVGYPCPGPCFCTKVLKSSRKWHTPKSRKWQKVRNTRFSKPSVLSVFRNPLTILVSFDHF